MSNRTYSPQIIISHELFLRLREYARRLRADYCPDAEQIDRDIIVCEARERDYHAARGAAEAGTDSPSTPDPFSHQGEKGSAAPGSPLPGVGEKPGVRGDVAEGPGVRGDVEAGHV